MTRYNTDDTDDPNAFVTPSGQTLVADGGGGVAVGQADAGAAAPGGQPGVQKAEQMDGQGGFQTACLKSQAMLQAHRGDPRVAAQAVKAWQRHRVENSQLRHREWKEIDDTVMQIAQQTRVMAQDLIDRGLTIPLDLGTLRWEWEDVDDTGDAQVDMGAETGGEEDLPDFALNGIPLPVIHKSFRINARKLRASRNRGDPLDTTAAFQATRAVNQKIEDIMADGVSITVDGDTIDGYTTHPDRNQVTGNADWSSASSDNMIDDVLSTIEAIEDDNRGDVDMVFYLARQQFQEIRAKNAGTDDKRGVLDLVRARLESEEDFPGVTFKRADHLDAGEGVLVEMAQDVVQLAVPSDIQAIEWESQGGMVLHNKVMGSMIPVLKSDRNANMGLAHITGI